MAFNVLEKFNLKLANLKQGVEGLAGVLSDTGVTEPEAASGTGSPYGSIIDSELELLDL